MSVGLTPSGMAEHLLDTPKGWDAIVNVLDFSAPYSANIEFDVPPGRVAHLNSSGEFEMGVAGNQMPLYLRTGTNNPDVRNQMMSAGGRFLQSPGIPAGNGSAVVGTGGFELASSEFDADPATPYAPNQLLTAKADNTTAAVGGVLSNDRNGAGGSAGPVRQYTDPACGVVSRGVVRPNEHSVDLLHFWSIYLPAAFA